MPDENVAAQRVIGIAKGFRTLGHESVEFVFISRIMNEKGIDQYLEAARVIRKKYPQTRFHVCGYCEPEYDGELQKLVDDGTVIYHGLVDDIAAMHEKNIVLYIRHITRRGCPMCCLRPVQVQGQLSPQTVADAGRLLMKV